MRKKIYTCFCTDVIHEGHRNIIEQAKKYGDVTIGVLSDEAMIRYNRFPTIPFEQRVNLVKEIEGIEEVVIQNTIMYDGIIESIRPDYVIHCDNWNSFPEASIRNNVLHLFSQYC